MVQGMTHGYFPRQNVARYSTFWKQDLSDIFGCSPTVGLSGVIDNGNFSAFADYFFVNFRDKNTIVI